MITFKTLKEYRKSKMELIKTINTLENENETLREELKTKIVKDVLKNYDKILMYDKIVKDNKRLRKINRKLKEK